MNVSIRDYIKKNFKDSNESEIKDSITSSISEGEEVSLPGLGVLFEILWSNSGSDIQETILKNIKSGL